MARNFITGFATGAPSLDTNTSTLPAGVSYDTGIVRTGPRSLKIQPASGSSVAAVTVGPTSAGGSATDSYRRFYIRATVLPSSTARTILGTRGLGLNLRLNPSGTIDAYNGSTLLGTSSTALSDTSKWYRVETRSADGTGVVVLRIEGTDEVTASPSTWQMTGTAGVDNDTVADTYTIYLADLATDDAAFPGDGKVVWLAPASDNSVGTGWQKPGGATTNLYTSVDNLPPVGIADTTSAADAEKQIRNASDAAANYVANLTTYAAAGIGASDTVNAVWAMCVHGAPTTTGAKTGALTISNPAQGPTAFTSTSNRFHSGTNAGTYPTGWHHTKGAIIDSPTVTIANAPVLTVDITGGTASRIAMVCAAGMYVDYTPGAPAQAPAPPVKVIGQSVMRATLH